jgi:hypothetical protein
VDSIPDEVIGFFNSPNLSSHTVALELTQPLTEISTRNLPGGKGRQSRKADNLTGICEPIVWKMWEPRRLTPVCAFTACYRNMTGLLMNRQLEATRKGVSATLIPDEVLACVVMH